MKRKGIYIQIEQQGYQFFARIRSKETIYSWSVFLSYDAAKEWASKEYDTIRLPEG